MARKARLFVKETPLHIYLQALDRLKLFHDAEDYETYLTLLEELSTLHSIKIHAFMLQTEFCEFLLTPESADATAKFLQTLSRSYVGYYNKKYTHKGTIWSGRYKSSLVEASHYLLHVMKFIESKASKQYLYSSFKENTDDATTSLVTKHKLYKDAQEYREFFEQETPQELNTFIETALNKQSVTGSTEYIKELEKEIGKALLTKSRGRPTKKEQIQRKKMYKNLVILDKQKHATLKVNPLENLLFAKNTPHIPITLEEVATVAKLFPVVFSVNEEPSLTALIGLDGENLAISLDGKWIDSYIPSHIGKYPFALASTPTDNEQKIVMIDEDASVVSKSKGKQLFKKNGEKSEVLENAIEKLVTHEKNINEMKKIAKEIADAGVLQKSDITVGSDDEEKVLVEGFQVVVPAKVKQLNSKVLADWDKRGILKLIDLHLNSLKNIEVLFKIASQRQN